MLDSHTPIFNVMTVAFAILILLALIKPGLFRFLLDKDSVEPSLGRQGQYVALVVSTWALMWLVIHDKLTEFFFTSYMLAWAGAQFGSIFLKMKGKQDEAKTP